MMKNKAHPNNTNKPPAAGGKSLIKSDPLQRYLSEIRTYPLLTPEEEYALAVRYAETRDVDAAQKLVLGNLRLVVKIAFDFVRLYQNVLDLIQEGNIGLMQAIKKYDPYKGVKLSTYAAWWIRAYILKFIMDNYRIYKIGTTAAQKKLFFKLNQEYERIMADGDMPSPRLLAESFDVRESDVIEMQQILKGDEVSLDAPIQEDSKTSFMHFFSSKEIPVDERLADSQFMKLFTEKLREFSRTLGEKELLIFKKRLLSENPATLQEIANSYKISRERVRQIETRLIRKLKKYLSQFDAFAGIHIDQDHSPRLGVSDTEKNH